MPRRRSAAAVEHADDQESTMAKTSPVESVDRALLALQVLARAGAPGMTLADLAAALDLNKSTVHRARSSVRSPEAMARFVRVGGGSYTCTTRVRRMRWARTACRAR